MAYRGGALEFYVSKAILMAQLLGHEKIYLIGFRLGARTHVSKPSLWQESVKKTAVPVIDRQESLGEQWKKVIVKNQVKPSFIVTTQQELTTKSDDTFRFYSGLFPSSLRDTQVTYALYSILSIILNQIRFQMNDDLFQMRRTVHVCPLYKSSVSLSGYFFWLNSKEERCQPTPFRPANLGRKDFIL